MEARDDRAGGLRSGSESASRCNGLHRPVSASTDDLGYLSGAAREQTAPDEPSGRRPGTSSASRRSQSVLAPTRSSMSPEPMHERESPGPFTRTRRESMRRDYVRSRTTAAVRAISSVSAGGPKQSDAPAPHVPTLRVDRRVAGGLGSANAGPHCRRHEIREMFVRPLT